VSTLPHPINVRASKPSIVLAVIMMMFGFLAIILPIAASIGIARVAGWLLLFDGIAQIIHSIRSQGIGHLVWKLLIAGLYLTVGVYLLAHPVLALAAITLVLTVFFFAQGIVDIIAYFSTRKNSRSPWMLLGGIVTLALALMIWRHWPSGSLWVIGTVVGVSMLMTGTTRLMMALAARKLEKEHEGQALAGNQAA
jgi:uncharacterized membrane protein HdeD (DUF308 family)